MEPLRGCEEQIGIGFRMLDLVARHHGNVRTHAQHVQHRLGAFPAPAGRDRPRHPRLREIGEQVARARERADLRDLPRERRSVGALHPRDLLGAQATARLAEQRVEEQSPAHADAAVDAPHGELEAGRLQRLAPREHVLVDAVNEGAVEIEEETGDRHGVGLAKSGVPRQDNRP